MKKLLIILSFIIFSSNVYADAKFEKDLKKVSKDSGFVDDKGKIYSAEEITDKENTILIIFSHGSSGDQKIDKCLESWAKPPPVILNLHDQKIKNLQIKVYRLCSGVRGWSQKEQNKLWKAHQRSGKLDLKLIDKEGTPIVQKQKQIQKAKVIKKQIDSFIEQGFKNIVLAGHSSGGWQSIALKSRLPKKIKGVIAFHPGGGGTLSNRKNWPWWNDVRSYQISLMDLPNLKNALIFTHDKDEYNSPEDYSFLSNLNSVQLINLTGSGCKKKKSLSNYHGIALTKCFAEKDNNIVPYLEKIF